MEDNATPRPVVEPDAAVPKVAPANNDGADGAATDDAVCATSIRDNAGPPMVKKPETVAAAAHSEDEGEDEAVDPRVEGTLMKLNTATDDINTAESRLEVCVSACVCAHMCFCMRSHGRVCVHVRDARFYLEERSVDVHCTPAVLL